MRISDWSSDVCSSDLWLLRRTAGTRKAITNGDGLPRISLVIAAHNEASVIESKVRNALALDYPRELLEVIVTDDGSTDDTAALAQGAGANFVLRNSRGGKIRAQDAAVRRATGEEIGRAHV